MASREEGFGIFHNKTSEVVLATPCGAYTQTARRQ